MAVCHLLISRSKLQAASATCNTAKHPYQLLTSGMHGVCQPAGAVSCPSAYCMLKSSVSRPDLRACVGWGWLEAVKAQLRYPTPQRDLGTNIAILVICLLRVAAALHKCPVYRGSCHF